MLDPTVEVVRRLVVELAEQPVGDEDRLEGVLDSLQLEQLISGLETTYGLQFDDAELVTENFQDIETLAGLIDSKRALRA